MAAQRKLVVVAVVVSVGFGLRDGSGACAALLGGTNRVGILVAVALMSVVALSVVSVMAVEGGVKNVIDLCAVSNFAAAR